MWKNTVDRNRPQMATRRMRIAWWMPNLRLQMHTQNKEKLLLLNCNSGRTKEPNRYLALRCLPCFKLKRCVPAGKSEKTSTDSRAYSLTSHYSAWQIHERTAWLHTRARDKFTSVRPDFTPHHVTNSRAYGLTSHYSTWQIHELTAWLHTTARDKFTRVRPDFTPHHVTNSRAYGLTSHHIT